MKIAFLTDIHLDERQVTGYGVAMRSNWERLLDAIAREKPDMVIFGGDIGEASSHQYLVESLAKFPEVRLLLGNHDRYGDVIESMRHLVRGQNSQSFSETIAGQKCVFMDSSTGELDSRQMALLEKALQHDRLVIFIHHPILPVAGYVDTHYPLRSRDAIQKLIDDSGASVTVFCGHYHMADVRRSGKITQYIAPAASYQISKGTEKLIPDPTQFGYRIIEMGETIATYCVLFDQ